MLNKINISFNNTDCISEKMLNDYQAGLLSKDKIRQVELHLADCEMCSDYVEGLSYLKNSNELKIESQIIINKLNKISTKKNKIWLFAAAASVFIAISISSLILIFPSKNKFVADNLKNSYQKNDAPAEAKQQKELSWEKDNSEVAYDKISINEQSKITEKSSATINNKRTQIDNITKEDKSINYKTTISGDIQSEAKGESDKLVITNNVTSLEDESKIIVSDVVTNGQAKTEIKTSSILTEESVDRQANKKNENYVLIAKTESSKDKKSSERNKEKATKNAPASVEQTAVSTGAVGGYEILSADLDEASINLQKQKTDSVIILALRGANSTNDSIKWKSKLLLAKAYLLSGEKEKAITLFDEIKKNSQGNFKKEAQKELEKLGF